MYLVGSTLNHISQLFRLMNQISAGSAKLEKSGIDLDGLPEIAANVRKVQNEIVQLIDLYDQEELQSTFQPALPEIESILVLIEQILKISGEWSIRTHFLWPPGEIKWKNRLLAANKDLIQKVKDLQKQTQNILDALVAYVLDLMPIPLSQKTANRISYDQVRRNSQSSIQLAFALFEDHVREKTGVGHEVYGENLINVSFGKNARLVYGDVPAEQAGVRNLISGAYAVFRNPRMHRIIEDDENTALIIIGLIDLLMRIVDDAVAQ